VVRTAWKPRRYAVDRSKTLTPRYESGVRYSIGMIMTNQLKIKQLFSTYHPFINTKLCDISFGSVIFD